MVCIYVQITNFLYSIFIQFYGGHILSTDGLRIWEHPNTEYARKLNGPQHNSREQYGNAQALPFLKNCSADGWLNCRQSNQTTHAEFRFPTGPHLHGVSILKGSCAFG